MKKKILLSFAILIAVTFGIVGMSAFEAHVINVTAKIENALSVLPDKIEFGTVFPEELLVEQVEITMSSSFAQEDRADDINYFIKQKPKPRPEPDRDLPVIKPDYNMYLPGGQFDGQLYPHFIDNDAQRSEYCHTHSPADPADPDDLYYINCYPSLCEYLSKHDADTDDENDDLGLDPFHPIGEVVNGRLAKSEDDRIDLWDIDLLVPCFEGMCAQDGVVPLEYQLPPALESEVFGCDLWIEVTGISRVGEELPVEETDTWSQVDLDGKEWFSKAKVNEPNPDSDFEVQVGVDDTNPAMFDSDDTVWTDNQQEAFTLTYDGAGNATFAVVGVPSVNYAVGAGTFGRIGITLKAPADATTYVDNLALDLGPLAITSTSVSGGTKSLTISGADLSSGFVLTGNFTFDWGVLTSNGENQKVQFSID